MSVSPLPQIVMILMGFLGCTSIATALENDDVVASIDGKAITYQTMIKGSELDIYEAELKLHQLRMNRLKQTLVSWLISKDPRSQGIGEQQFVDRFIVTPLRLTEADVDAFVRDRKIPADQVNAELKQKIRQHLNSQHYMDQIEAWFSVQAKKYNIQINLPEPPEPRFQVVVGDAPYLGGKDAKVTVVEFSDFECPYCVKASKVVQELNQIYGDKIKIVYKHFPLSFHPNAQKAAEAGICATQQGNQYFWELHNAMFADYRNLTIGSIKDKAKDLGLDYQRFSDCLTSGQNAEKVTEDIREGIDVGVSSTPAFFINGLLVKGALPLEVFVEKINQELAK